MNIPRQFYGVNYLSKIVSNYQDKDITYFPKTEYHYLNGSDNINLDKSASYKLGLNADVVYNFLKKLMSDRSCGVEGIAVAKGEDVLVNFYRPPYSETTPHITNSTCKTVTAIAVMFALSEERFSLEDKVVSFFDEYESKAIPSSVREITIEHLLTMTSCSKTNELISVCEDDWVKAFLLTDCSEKPGSRFIYNSMNTYMLGAILIKVTGESLMDYLTPRLWKPLGISGIKWELCPKGLERGGWGLHISLEGMLKLGMLLSSDGSFHGRQLIQPSFIRMMKNKRVLQDTDRLSTGYGYQIWHLPDGMYMLSGMYGQHVIVNEAKGLVVAVNAHSDKMFPDSKLTRNILAFINNEELTHSGFILKERMNYNKLVKFVKFYSTDYVSKEDAERIRRYIGRLDHKRLRIENGTVKLFPYLMQSMYMYPPYHINEMALKIVDDNRLKIGFYKAKTKKEHIETTEGNGILEGIKRFGFGKKELNGKKEDSGITDSDNVDAIDVGTDKICDVNTAYMESDDGGLLNQNADNTIINSTSKENERQRIDLLFGIGVYHHEMKAFGDDVRPVACKAYMAQDEDERNVIMLNIVFPDAGYSRQIKIFFMDDNKLALECVEYPDIKAIVDQVLSGETVLAGNAVDLVDKLPESVRVMLDQQMEPRMNVSLKQTAD